jgi:hypothetical protein
LRRPRINSDPPFEICRKSSLVNSNEECKSEDEVRKPRLSESGDGRLEEDKNDNEIKEEASQDYSSSSEDSEDECSPASKLPKLKTN